MVLKFRNYTFSDVDGDTEFFSVEQWCQFWNQMSDNKTICLSCFLVDTLWFMFKQSLFWTGITEKVDLWYIPLYFGIVIYTPLSNNWKYIWIIVLKKN